MSDAERDSLEGFISARDEQLATRAGLGAGHRDDMELSDEEVFGLPEASESESESYENLDDAGSSRELQDEFYEAGETKKSRLDNLGDWGSRRENYYGGGDDVGDEEEASEEEEAEALRIQREKLESMDEGDFVDEEDIEGWRKDAESHDLDDSALQHQHEALPQQDPASMSPAERLSLIEDNYPEVILLAKELQRGLDTLKELGNSADTNQAVIDIQLTALRSYVAMIYSYFALFSDRVKNGPVDLKEHPVMEDILKARELWRMAKSLDDAPGNPDEQLSGASASDAQPDEIDQSEEQASDSDIEETRKRTVQHPPSNNPRAGIYSEDDDLSMEEPYSDSQSGSDQEEEEEEDDFSVELAKPRQSAPQLVGDFDETADSIERQARAKNKQSLRFYTSQIGKQERARVDQFQGDVDLPYQERAYERRKRLLEEARRRGREAQDRLGGDENGDDNDSDTNEPAQGLYSQVQHARDASKTRKREEHEQAVEAAKQGRIAEYLAENPTGNKRAINYQIAKNKGLTQKRKKENRNARVKKRVRYEQAQKQLKGARRVYQAPSGPYGGELTGIRKNLSHSKRFTD